MSDELKAELEKQGLTVRGYEAWLVSHPLESDDDREYQKIFIEHGAEGKQATVAENAALSPEEAGLATMEQQELLQKVIDLHYAGEPVEPEDRDALIRARMDADSTLTYEEAVAAHDIMIADYAQVGGSAMSNAAGFFDEAGGDVNPWLDSDGWIQPGQYGILKPTQKLDVMSLYNHTILTTGINPQELMFTGEGSDTNTWEQNVIIGTKQYFANATDMTEAILRDWSDANGFYMAKEDQDAFRLYKALDGELTFGQSKSLIRSAETAGVETDMAWLVYSIAKKQGLHIAEPWAGKSPESKAAEAEWNAKPDRDPVTGNLIGSAADVADPGRGATMGGGFQGPAVPQSPDTPWTGGSTVWGNDLTMAQITGQTPHTVFTGFLGSMDKYGSEIVAMVAMSNGSLADRMYNDPYSLTGSEWSEVDRLIDGSEQWETMPGMYSQAKFIQQRLSGAQTVVQVDSAGAMDAARTLAASWNMPELSDAMLESIASGQRSALLSGIKASQGNPFQPSVGGPVTAEVPSDAAAAARALRGTPEYASLFANKRSGESEVEYAQRFDMAVAKFMNDSDPMLARIGMRTGDPESVGQGALASGQAFDNSQFMKKLTDIGTAFKRGT